MAMIDASKEEKVSACVTVVSKLRAKSPGTIANPIVREEAEARR
jgi:hypothetical protein